MVCYAVLSKWQRSVQRFVWCCVVDCLWRFKAHSLAWQMAVGLTLCICVQSLDAHTAVSVATLLELHVAACCWETPPPPRDALQYWLGCVLLLLMVVCLFVCSISVCVVQP